MECWHLSNHKSLLYWLLILMMIEIFMVRRVHGGCIEEERKALIEIKASVNSYSSAAYDILLTWVDGGGAECCDWERVKCNTTTGHVTELSLDNLRDEDYQAFDFAKKEIWPLNVSLFLHFKELKSLNLSYNHLDNGIVNTGLGRLSSLKKLEILDLSWNDFENGIFPSLGALTSLRILDLSNNVDLGGYFPSHEFAALENLETLDLANCNFNGTLQIQGFERVSRLRKLKTLNLAWNGFNESIITSLRALPSLKALGLTGQLSGSFPAQELAHLTNLEKLDLSYNRLDHTPTIQDCKTLSRLKRLENLSLGGNNFNKSIISCLSALPSLKILDLSMSLLYETSFPIRELSGLRELKTLDLSECWLESLSSNEMHNMPDLEVLLLSNNNFKGTLQMEALASFHHLEVLLLSDNQFNGTLPMEAFASFQHLEVLDLSGNYFVGSIPSTIKALSSLRAVSFARNQLNGSLSIDVFCELKNLHELDLSGNMFEGDLPPCFNGLSSLKLFDVSSNGFTGPLPPSLIANLTSLEYIDFSHNRFEGSLSFSSFSNHTKLEAVIFINDNYKFEVETEEPVGWIPMFQLKALVLSNCNINRRIGSVVPSFILHQHDLQELDLSHNALDGGLPNWVIENNTMLQVLKLRNNSFSGGIRMPSHRNVNMWLLDMSGNDINGTIPGNTQEFLPYITYLNLSGNALIGALPSLIGDLSRLWVLDLSNNELSGEVPNGLFTNCHKLEILVLSNNILRGEVLSRNLSLSGLSTLLLDNNNFTGEMVNESNASPYSLQTLDISNNLFSGVLPRWISNQPDY